MRHREFSLHTQTHVCFCNTGQECASKVVYMCQSETSSLIVLSMGACVCACLPSHIEERERACACMCLPFLDNVLPSDIRRACGLSQRTYMPKVWVRLPRSHINSKHIYVQTLSIRALSYKFCKGRILWTAGTRTCTREFIYALLSRYAQELASNPSVKHNPFPHHRVTLLLSRDTEHQQVTHTHTCVI